MINKFVSTFDYKLIYVFRINDAYHNGLLKIGDATVHTDSDIYALANSSKELNIAAKNRIKGYTSTAGGGFPSSSKNLGNLYLILILRAQKF